MKRAILLILLFGASLTAQSPDPGSDLERYRPTEEQARKLADNTREIGRIEESLAKKYGDLKLLGYVSEKDETFLPLRASHLNQFELRDTTVSEETVRIVWKNGAPAQFTFRVRTATVRGLRTVVTIFQLDSVREGKELREPDIHFITMETLSSGRGNLVYYILTPWNASAITETTRSYRDGGISTTYPLKQNRDPARKIEVMNRLLDSYRYLERHLDYLISRSVRKEWSDMNRYIPES
jgi:hypothetical protein